MKKLLMPILIAVIIIQLAVPVCMIISRYDTLRTGAEYRFKVNPVDPYDAFRGRYVRLRLNTEQNVRGNGRYGIIAVDADGYAFIESLTDEKPRAGAYVKSDSRHWFSMPVDRYYMNEKLAPRAESLTWRRETDQITYVTVRVKNGDLVIEGLFIDGIAIEEVIRQSLSDEKLKR